jgi:hypothetical protein
VVTTTEYGMEFLGMMLLLVGAMLALCKRKRRFDRTNQFGIERFSSFRAKLGAITKDNLLGALSIILSVAGLLVLAFRFEDSWGWVVTLPVYGFMLYLVLGT